MSLRRRVLAYVVVAALASCVLTVGVAVVLVRHRVATQRVGTLDREANAVAALAPSGTHVYRLLDGRLRAVKTHRASAVLAAIPPTASPDGTAKVMGADLLYAERRTPAGRIVVVRPAALAFGEWRPFLASLLLAGLGGALLAGLSSWLLARRLTRPIADLAAATARLSAGEPDTRVAVDGDGELADLGHSFNAMSAQLSRAREEQRHFLESVSHELKTPLTSIRGYAEALSDGAVTPGQAAAVIADESGRLQRLVSDLLDLARLTRAEFSVAAEPVDLHQIARQAVQRHLPRAHELGVELRHASDGADAAAAGLGDADRLLQAVSNLIENALRVTPAAGSVTVAARPGELSVVDTGPGLTAEDLPHAFERFYLYERYRSERAVGSGLGLAIVRELAERMGGGISVENAPGAGARFTLRVPTPRAPAEAVRPAQT